ncbi:hypothetical protein [Nesterenkonia rhizosphaerae]|uniref:Uncharacterized protein n=1 Tax=Nesterenkonia rhizosphaerae TaxID=1348272 RepID=A0ABP9FTJ5_9MICC
MSTDDLRVRLEADKNTIQAATEHYDFPLTFQPWGGQNQNGDYAESILMDHRGETLAYGLPDGMGIFAEQASIRWEKATTALLKLLELHKRDEYDDCSACMSAYGDGIPYPCPTVESILEVYT